MSWNFSLTIPSVKKLIRLSDEYVAPKVQELAPKVSDAMETLRSEIQEVTTDTARATLEAGAKAKKEVCKRMSKKNCNSGKCPKGLAFLVLSLIAGGVGFILWRRSQPVEDPWAEEYWAEPGEDSAPEAPSAESSDEEQPIFPVD